MFKMLIGVDGSEHALRCIDAVAAMARQWAPIEVVIVNVREGPMLHGDLPSLGLEAYEAALQRQQDQTLAIALARADDCGLKVTSTRREQGSAAAEILRVATECAADQIVLCTRGMGALGTLLLGSVAQRVVHLAELPVLLVK